MVMFSTSVVLVRFCCRILLPFKEVKTCLCWFLSLGTFPSIPEYLPAGQLVLNLFTYMLHPPSVPGTKVQRSQLLCQLHALSSPYCVLAYLEEEFIFPLLSTCKEIQPQRPMPLYLYNKLVVKPCESMLNLTKLKKSIEVVCCLIILPGKEPFKSILKCPSLTTLIWRNFTVD